MKETIQVYLQKGQALTSLTLVVLFEGNITEEGACNREGHRRRFQAGIVRFANLKEQFKYAGRGNRIKSSPAC